MPKIENRERERKGINLMDLNGMEAREFMESFDLVIIESEGVLWKSFGNIPNAAPGVSSLKSAGKFIKILTRNSSRSESEHLTKLHSVGISDVKPFDIITPSRIMLTYIKNTFSNQKVFSLCNSDVNEIFMKNGVQIEYMEPLSDVTVHDLIDKLSKLKTKIAAVIYDLNFNLTFIQLAVARHYLSIPQCALVVGSIDSHVPVSDTYSTIGTASIITLLCDGINKEPVVLGKTGSTLSKEIIKLYNVTAPKRVLYIANNLLTDMSFGNQSGFQTLFISSGMSKLEQLTMLDSEHLPDYVLEKLLDFVDFFTKYA